MANPVSQLQEIDNKADIELFSVELKAGVHYTKTAKTATYSQSGTTITITLNSHGFSTGLMFLFMKPLFFTWTVLSWAGYDSIGRNRNGLDWSGRD